MSHPHPEISPEIETALRQSFEQATKEHHEIVSLELLLVHLLESESCKNLFKVFEADIDVMRNKLLHFIKEYTPISEDTSVAPEPTHAFHAAIQHAMLYVKSQGEPVVDVVQLLIAIAGEKSTHAATFLREQGLTKINLVNYVSKGLTPKDEAKEQEVTAEQEETVSDTDRRSDPLEAFTSNLNKAAAEGKIDPLIGRDSEVERTIQILCRRRKNNPLLVGEAGVGKTAIAEGLAWRIHKGDVPEVLKDCEIYSLDIGSLVAGTKYRGDFEARIKALLNRVKSDPKKIMFIDEIHTLIGAGAASGNNMDASNLLKSALAKGEMRSIGATTFNEYRRIFEQEHAIARRFQKIDINEPSVEDTIKILKGLQERFEAHHQVKYTPEALEAAATLASRHISTGHMPDKAIDVFDEAGAFQRTQSKEKAKGTITVKEIEETVAKIARIPSQNISRSDKERLRALEQDLNSVVFGQESATKALAMMVKRSKANLRNLERPVGQFLFVGPTGVGKTEMVKQLARSLSMDLIRFDMSEYMESHSVSKLIGSPPGYVGTEDGGQLTEAINKKPHAILLLDEIEKAHPSIYNILLQVMDHGRLVDNKGREANCKNLIIVMTSNVGATATDKNPLGFTQVANDSQNDFRDKALKDTFTPEFRNRLDAVVQFNSLSKENIYQVAEKLLAAFDATLRSREHPVSVIVDESVKKFLVEHGFDPKMGARPMERLIKSAMEDLIVDDLLFGDLELGGEVEFIVQKTPGEKDKIVRHILQAGSKPAGTRKKKQMSQ